MKTKKEKGAVLSLSRGFTLIEMLIVIAIIGILAATLIFAVSGSRGKAAAARAIADMTNIRNAIETAATEGCTTATISATTVTCTAPTSKIYARVNAAPSGITYTVSGTLSAYSAQASGFAGSATYTCDNAGCICSVSGGCAALP